MKVKLLKRIRKRFEIYYNPNGIAEMINGKLEIYNQQYSVRDYFHGEYYNDRLFESREDAISFIQERVQASYTYLRKRKTPSKYINKKIYYNVRQK